MTSAPQFQPLYAQVYDHLIGRLSRGDWKAGEKLPSEFELADALKVHQGTVRKALNKLVAENLLKRRQGKGTYVAEHSDESSLYRFFPYRKRGGELLIPETTVIKRRVRNLKTIEQEIFDLDTGMAHEVTRVRSLSKAVSIVEVVVQPLELFPGVDQIEELPNSLYALYQDQFDISITEVKDQLSAVQLPSFAAKALGLDKGAIALETIRQSIDLKNRVVELSTAYCNSNDFVYSVTLK